MSFKYWTEDDDDTLRERWHDLRVSVSDIATDMGRSEPSVRTRAKRLGLKRGRTARDRTADFVEERQPLVKYQVILPTCDGRVTKILLQTWNAKRARDFLHERAPRGSKIKRIKLQ